MGSHGFSSRGGLLEQRHPLVEEGLPRVVRVHEGVRREPRARAAVLDLATSILGQGNEPTPFWRRFHFLE